MDIEETFRKLYEETYTYMDGKSYLYDFSAAIFTTWSEGSSLEKELACRLMMRWMYYLRDEMWDRFRTAKHSENRPEWSDFRTSWLSHQKQMHATNPGFVAALEKLEAEPHDTF